MAKKIFAVIFAAILVLLPTIAGAILYFMPDEFIQTPVNISGTFYDNEGVSFDFNRNKNAFLASFFDEIYENSTPSVFNAEDIKYDKSYHATVVRPDRSEKFTLYLSKQRTCYILNEENKLYAIDTQYANSLLNTTFVISLYEKLHTPTLSTHSKIQVLPSSTDFKYTIKDGSSQSSDGLPTSSNTVTYYSSNTAKFNFSIKPDICNLKVYVGDELLFDGAYYNFKENEIPKSSTVKYEIEATWVKSNENDCFGTATYSFFISYAPAPVFMLERASVNAGEFVLVKAANITDPERIKLSFSDELPTDPRFFKNGDDYYALVPLSHDMKSGNYKLTLECGETHKTFEIAVKERDQRTQKVESDASAALTEQAIANTYALISSIGSKSSTNIFVSDSFVNYEEDFSIRLGFAHLREFSDGTQYFLNGVDFYTDEGYDIPAANAGIICSAGEDAILGRYIVIDHGYGLKSWYCNISETSLSVGMRVKKGDTVAKTGSSDFYGQPGFFLITTVIDVPVAPYALYENNFLLPEQKN